MLDPWTSLSLATSIVQFIDFTAKLVSDSKDLYESGKTVQHADLETVFKDLKEVSNALQTRPKRATAFCAQLLDHEQVRYCAGPKYHYSLTEFRRPWTNS